MATAMEIEDNTGPTELNIWFSDQKFMEIGEIGSLFSSLVL